ncbi:MAG: hypothetical protein K0Q92_2983 [Steroidobacteraceae bacterium]|jgi:hypothetical protein|nr:hypothetical protein [Steroidobacteraceae bacterium]
MSNAWDKFFGGQWESNKKWDPLTHGLFEFVMKRDAHNVAAIDHGVSKAFGGDGSTILGDESRKVEKDPKRGIGRAALVAGAVFGAGALAGGGAGGAGAGAGAGAGGGAAAAGGGGAAAGSSGVWTPALIESAAGTSGYGLSSAGLGYTGAASGAGGVAGYNMGASNPALIDSAMGTSGYGASSAGGGGGAGAAGGLTGQQYQQMGQQASKMGDDAGSNEDDIDGVDLNALIAAEERRQRELDRMAMSSKNVKTPGGDSASVRRGLANADPIDANGVQIAAIQEMTRQVAAMQKRLDAVKSKRAKGN